jgi:hypothetical protein
LSVDSWWFSKLMAEKGRLPSGNVSKFSNAPCRLRHREAEEQSTHPRGAAGKYQCL